MDDHEDPSDVGVSMALDRICALEARIRQAIQHTHTLSSTFERDAQGADREREALLAVREMLELLEDKLREFRDSKGDEDRQTMALSQLDSLRRELITASRDSLPMVMFSKDVVKEVLAFAEMSAGGEAPPPPRDMPLSPIQQVNNNGLYSPHGRSPAYGKPSPKPRKDLLLRTSVGENMLGPAPVPARSTTPKQTRRGLWQPDSPTHLRGTLEEADRIIYAATRNPDAGSRRQSPSQQLQPARVRDDEQELYSTTNGSSRYHYDPEYGGKVSLTKMRHRQDSAAPDLFDANGHLPALEHGARVRDPISDDRSTRSARTAYDPRLDDDVSSVSTRAWSHQPHYSPAPSSGGTRRLGLDVQRTGRVPAPEPVTVPLPQPRTGRGFWGTIGVCLQILAAGAVAAGAAVLVSQGAEYYQSQEQQAKRAVRRTQRAEQRRIQQEARAVERQHQAVRQQALAEERQQQAIRQQALAQERQQALAAAAAERQAAQQAAQEEAALRAKQAQQAAQEETALRAKQAQQAAQEAALQTKQAQQAAAPRRADNIPARTAVSDEAPELPHVGMQLKAPPAGVLFPALPPPDVFQGRG